MRFNWRVWGGLALIVLGFVAYFALFVRFPVTRDVPWAPYLMFVAGFILIVVGWRRASRKIAASIAAALAVVVVGFFTFAITSSRGLPASVSAPAMGETVPDFTLPDANGREFRLADALAENNGVLLIFYRGYW